MTTYVHRDITGKQIKLGDYVVSLYYNSMVIGIITKLNAKTIQYKYLYNPYNSATAGNTRTVKIKDNVVIIENTPHVTSLLLKQGA
jgi:hypothetical protein